MTGPLDGLLRAALASAGAAAVARLDQACAGPHPPPPALPCRPAQQRRRRWGRVIFRVADVDALHERALAAGYRPTTAPRGAEWGERFFHPTDPDGHDLSFARPLRPLV